MHATPCATSPNIFRISDSVKRSCNRVFIKSINPPPNVNSNIDCGIPEQNSMRRNTSYPPFDNSQACESMYVTTCLCPFSRFYSSTQNMSFETIVSTSVRTIPNASLSGAITLFKHATSPTLPSASFIFSFSRTT